MKKIIIICTLILTQSVFAKDKMDKFYQDLINANRNDKKRIIQIKDTQRKYHIFLEAQRDLMYPGWIGIDRRTCAYNYKNNIDSLIMKITKELYKIEEDDICAIRE